ncbi:MAG TPA: hypothetical protein VM491_24135 [Burkholderiaceae bacterium]|nr:hypothetical protein [Burkholderiaceae bacterium]
MGTRITWLAAAIALAGWAGAAAAIELGDASVMSQQGQRLKVAIPFGAIPGERVPVLRVMVESVEAPAGFAAPDAGGFTVAMPDRRRVIYLQSREPVTAPSLTMRLRIVGDEQSPSIPVTLRLPPAVASAPDVVTAAAR